VNQTLLGVLKWHGIFLHRGVQQAFHWLNLARKNQHQEVDKLISEVQSVVRKLSDEKRKAADVLVRVPSSQELEPSANPGRFNAAEPKNPSLRRASRWNSFDDETNATQIARTPGSRVRPEDDYHGVQRDAYALGRRLGRQCLKRAARGRVKCIYIDPPYNTGSAFEYYDDGVEHSVWLSLIRSRLELLKALLSEDGSIWVSADDNEGHYLKVLMDEIFGRKNFVANVIWQKRYAPSNDALWLSENHDHIFCYAKNKDIWRPYALPRTAEQDT
jgi:DNA methylase